MLTPEEQAALTREFDALLESEIEARLVGGLLHGDKRDFARAYLERKRLNVPRPRRLPDRDCAAGERVVDYRARYLGARRADSPVQGLVGQTFDRHGRVKRL